jgi:glycosyltransferase involved in cell wall biosynthesis
MSSLIAQDFPFEHVELIVVDGCSKDRTLDIIKKYVLKVDMRCRIFHENQGLGEARQIVVDNANGEYIFWLDGDLVLSKDYLRILFQLISKNPRIGIAKGKYSLEPGANSVATLEIYSRAASKMVDFNSQIETNSMGTAGCIYRVQAIREIGGFDRGIKGYGEDWDAEYRVRVAGWLLSTVDVYYRDYERHGLTWKSIWRKYLRRGVDSRYILKKNRNAIELYKWTPPAALISGLFHALTLYKFTHKKIVFFLPVEQVFKMTAWYTGFLKTAFASAKIPPN